MRDHGVGTDDPAAAGRDDAEALALRAVRRDQDAWAQIFDAHYRSIYAFVRYRLRRAAEAEDIAARVFEVAYSRADRFDYRGLPIEAWLIGIARNLVRDHVRKLGRRGYEEGLVEAMALTGPGEAEAADLRHDLGAAMRSLTDDQQTVITLRFLLDRSVAETARLMDRSEDAVKNLQRRALAAMHRALVGAGYDGGPR